MLQEDSTLNHAEIRWAIEATIEPRKMTMPAAVPVGFSDPFALVTIKQTQQNAFLKNNRLQAVVLADVVETLHRKFQPIAPAL